jgi:hypothetical protein
LSIEQDCEPTQYLCSCDHVTKNATGYFIKTTILAAPPILNDLTFFQNKEPRFTLPQRFFQTEYL